MGKGKLGPEGWEVGDDDQGASTSEKDIADQKLVKKNTALITQVKELKEKNTALEAENEELKAVNETYVGAIRLADVRTALEMLDHSVNENWTEENLPRVEVICGLLDDDTVSREEIAGALPGFVREVPKEE